MTTPTPTPAPLSAEEVKRLQELEAKATPGPWHALKDPNMPESQPPFDLIVPESEMSRPEMNRNWLFEAQQDFAEPGDAAFVAVLRNAAPSLLASAARVAELEAVISHERAQFNKEAEGYTAVIQGHRDGAKKLRMDLLAAESECARLREQLGEARKGIKAVRALINDSSGVYGLHLNGDPSPWSELESGGRFEDWLREFNAAEESIKRHFAPAPGEE